MSLFKSVHEVANGSLVTQTQQDREAINSGPSKDLLGFSKSMRLIRNFNTGFPADSDFALFLLCVVVTGATDGIGKAYAEDVSYPGV